MRKLFFCCVVAALTSSCTENKPGRYVLLKDYNTYTQDDFQQNVVFDTQEGRMFFLGPDYSVHYIDYVNNLSGIPPQRAVKESDCFSIYWKDIPGDTGQPTIELDDLGK